MIRQEELNFNPNYYYVNMEDPFKKAPEDKPNRFNLEEQIFDCWHVTDDLDVLFEAVVENNLTEDQISNVLLGMKELYHLKFERLFDTFEKMIQSGKM